MENESQHFDLIVIGGGPGGYPAAIRAAQRGKTVALIEAKELGGTCLNRGCIPSKTLIASADILHKIQESESFGITCGSVHFDYSKMVERKDNVVNKIRKSLETLINTNKIKVFKGFGKLMPQMSVKVIGEASCLLTASHIIIATGSEPKNIAAFPFDGKKIHDSTTLLEMRELPKKLAIVGGGVIGCEFACLYRALGVEVVIIEMMPRIIPMESEDISNALSKAFKRQGIEIETGAVVETIDTKGQGVTIRLTHDKVIQADIALVAIGRTLNTVGIGLENAGVMVNENGIIPVNDRMETSSPGIYAVGDIASKWWLAHVATHQGLVAANNAIGIESHMNYQAVPLVIFTVPEIASVGLSLAQSLEKGYAAVTAAFPFQALGKSQACLQTDGFAQIVIDKTTGQVLGAQVVGYEASVLIAEMAIVIANELTVECITETMHAHPTIAEAWLEAALIGESMPLHWPPRLLKSG